MAFTFKIIISFIAGGLFIALQTLIGERVRGFLRNVILTIPSTMALGLIFIGITKTPNDVVETARIIPAALASDYLFVTIFALLSAYGLFFSLAGSFFAWTLGAFLILKFPPETFLTSIFIYGLPLIIIGYLIVRILPQVPDLKPFPMNIKHIIFRSFIGGSVIALVVILSNTLGNIWGGLFSAFPAVFTSTFIIYTQLQGKKVIPSVSKSLFFPGSIGLIIYALVAAITFPIWGIWLGTLAAYSANFLFFWLSSFFYKRS